MGVRASVIGMAGTNIDGAVEGRSAAPCGQLWRFDKHQRPLPAGAVEKLDAAPRRAGRCRLAFREYVHMIIILCPAIEAIDALPHSHGRPAIGFPRIRRHCRSRVADDALGLSFSELGVPAGGHAKGVELATLQIPVVAEMTSMRPVGVMQSHLIFLSVRTYCAASETGRRGPICSTHCFRGRQRVARMTSMSPAASQKRQTCAAPWYSTHGANA